MRSLPTDIPARSITSRGAVVRKVLTASTYILDFRGAGLPEIGYFSGARELAVGTYVQAEWHPEQRSWEITDPGADIVAAQAEGSLTLTYIDEEALTLQQRGGPVMSAAKDLVWGSNSLGQDIFLMTFNGSTLGIESNVDPGVSTGSMDRHRVLDQIVLAERNASNIHVMSYNASTGALTILDTLTILGLGNFSEVRFSPDGDFIAVGSDDTNGLHVFPWNGTDTIGAITSVSDSGGAVLDVSWERNGAGIFVARGSSGLSYYPWTGSSFGTRVDLGSIPDSGTAINWVACHPDNSGVGIHIGGSSTFYAFVPWTGSAFGTPVLDTNTFTGWTSSQGTVAWSLSGGYLFVGGVSKQGALPWDGSAFGTLVEPDTHILGISAHWWLSDDNSYLVGYTESNNILAVWSTGLSLAAGATVPLLNPVDATDAAYTPANASHWVTPPTTVRAALEELAERTRTLEVQTISPAPVALTISAVAPTLTGGA